MKTLIEQGIAYTKDDGPNKSNYQFTTKTGCGATKDQCMCCMQKHTHFWIDKKGAEDAGKEIVRTNLHLEGKALDEYMKWNFDDTWKFFNVMGTGWIEIERMS